MTEYILRADEHLVFFRGEFCVVDNETGNVRNAATGVLVDRFELRSALSVASVGDRLYYMDQQLYILDTENRVVRNVAALWMHMDTLISHNGAVFPVSFALSRVYNDGIEDAEYRGSTARNEMLLVRNSELAQDNDRSMLWGRTLPPMHRVVSSTPTHGISRVGALKWYAWQIESMATETPVWQHLQPQPMSLLSSIKVVLLNDHVCGLNRTIARDVFTKEVHGRFSWESVPPVYPEHVVGYRNGLIGTYEGLLFASTGDTSRTYRQFDEDEKVGQLIYDNGRVRALYRDGTEIDVHSRAVPRRVYLGTDADNKALWGRHGSAQVIWGRVVPKRETIVCVYEEFAITRMNREKYVVYQRVAAGPASADSTERLARSLAGPASAGSTPVLSGSDMRPVAGPASAGDLGSKPVLAATFQALAATAPKRVEPEYQALLDELERMRLELAAAKAETERVRLYPESFGECPICMAAPKTHIFGLCGHMYCEQCATTITECSFCRSTAKNVAKIIL